MDNFGSIFSDKVNMGNQSSNIRHEHKREDSSNGTVYSRRSSSFLHYLFTLLKQAKEEMTTIKVGWILFNLLGWPTAILTLASALFGDIVLGEIAEPYKSIVIILGLVFLIVKILIAYEAWQEKHISNKEREFDLLQKKLNNHIQHTHSQSK
jgi:hypothetical protein